MGWFDSFTNNNNNDEEAAYQAANQESLPVAHAVAISASDSQDFVRPPPTNPSLLPYQATAVTSPPVGRIVSTSNTTKQQQQSPVVQSARVVSSSRTYTIPAGSPLLLQPGQQQHQPSVTHQSLHQQQEMIEFTRSPQLLAQCPECHAWNARTRIRTFPNAWTWCACVALVFVFWPLCWLPLVMDSMKHTDHYCLVCGKKVGTLPPFRNCCVKNSA